MRGRYTGTSIATEVLQVLLDTNTNNQLLAFTCNNASNNTTLSRAIKLSLEAEGIY